MKKPNKVPKNNIHDSLFKSIFSVKEHLQDLLNGTLPKDIINHINLDTLIYDGTEYVDENLSPYFRDISCNVLYGKTNLKIALLYEHKSFPSKNIHLQLLRYILNVWENQNANKAELTPVITLVFYHGNKKWNKKDLIQNLPEELKRFIPLFDYVLYNTNETEDLAILKQFNNHGVKVSVWVMKRNNNFINYIENNPDISHQILSNTYLVDKTLLEKLVLYLYHTANVEPEKVIEIMSNISTQANDPFEEIRNKLKAKAIREGLREGRKKGREEGREEGRLEGRLEGKFEGVKQTALNMIHKGFDDDTISEITDLPIETIIEMRKSIK